MSPTFAFLLLLPLQAAATYRVECTPFAAAFMDSIVAPGRKSSHAHHITGTLGFGDTIDAEAMVGNTTTCSMLGDHSNYWAPLMYRTDLAGGPQVMMPLFQSYYFFGPEDVPFLDPTAMSQPLAMLLGRSSGALPTDSFAISFLTRTGHQPDVITTKSPRYGWPLDATDVTEVMIAYAFPSCWNGGPYMADQSHMMYPDDVTNRCSNLTHPLQLPALRIEQRYVLDGKPIAWSKGAAPFFFSSGGETTAHADAVLLWESGLLSELIASCTGTDVGLCTVGEEQSQQQREALAESAFWIPDAYLTNTRAPTGMPTPAPSHAPTPVPTSKPTKSPTLAPTLKPSKAPTTSPTLRPTKAPTAKPSPKPTYKTSKPTPKPSKSPTKRPTPRPTKAPSAMPSPKPTFKTSKPTPKPSKSPTKRPTPRPTKAPTAKPSPKPTFKTSKPTPKPSKSPTHRPTPRPTKAPSARPSPKPTYKTGKPSLKPSKAPTVSPAGKPTKAPVTSMPTLPRRLSLTPQAAVSAWMPMSTHDNTSRLRGSRKQSPAAA